MAENQAISQTVTVLDSFRMDGKVALVTGASSGLGVTFAKGLAEAGADLVLAARRKDRLEETVMLVQQAGRRALAIQTDVTNPDACVALVQAGVEEFGHLDVLVNNAGLGGAVPATRELPEQFRAVVDVNLMGSYWLCQACAKVMEPGSSIINIGSVLGLTTNGMPQAAYAASKAAVFGLTRELARQWTGRKGIRVNAIAPGFFVTEMTAPIGMETLQQLMDDRVPMSRLGEINECTAAVVFLASDASSYVTGIVLPVDGGMLIT
jgi:NAD(P)-dependent dehydrogenase (short-subunit alcohol dehydrogenase family)